jgi:hypothetical protein
LCGLFARWRRDRPEDGWSFRECFEERLAEQKAEEEST